MKKLPVILAVDTKDESIADQLISLVSNKIDHIKLGLEFYLKNGYEAQGDYFEEDSIPHLKMNKIL